MTAPPIDTPGTSPRETAPETAARPGGARTAPTAYVPCPSCGGPGGPAPCPECRRWDAIGRHLSAIRRLRGDLP